MPPPKTTDDLLSRLQKSGLIPPTDLEASIAALPEGLDPPGILAHLVETRLLTQFQADRLAAGKYKGFVLGSYVILDKLGRGGMGQVFLAEHADMRRNVAIKVLPVKEMGSPVARERFLREARAAAALNHPNIVRAFDLSRDGQMYYLVMEYVEGVSLQALVARKGALPVTTAADYGRQVAEGLQHASERGLVHRDIKPANLLVDRSGGVRILDLGLVRASDEDSQLTNVTSGGRSILGTPDYLAPEQSLDSSAVDTRADIYSLGATIYFLLAGHPMFPEGRTAQKLMWQQWKDPTPINQLRPDVPSDLADILHKALAKKPRDRFQTPLEFAEALSGWATSPNPPDPDTIPPLPPRRSIRLPDPSASSVSSVGAAKRMRESSASWAFQPTNDLSRLSITPTVIPPPAPRALPGEPAIITLGPNGVSSKVTSLPPVQWRRKLPPLPEPGLDPALAEKEPGNGPHAPQESSSVDISIPPTPLLTVTPESPAVPRLKQKFPNGNPLAPGKVIHLGPRSPEEMEAEEAAAAVDPASHRNGEHGSATRTPPPSDTRQPSDSDPEFSTALPQRTGWSSHPANQKLLRKKPGDTRAWVLLGLLALVVLALVAAAITSAGR